MTRAARPLVVLFSACDPNAPGGSCRSDRVGLCIDYAADLSAADARAECDNLLGTYGAGQCDVSGALAGCEQLAKSSATGGSHLET